MGFREQPHFPLIPPTRPGRVLVMDDHGPSLAMIQGVLESAGFKVRTVDSGKSALELFPSFEPDLVILDILMPGMDGLEVCRRLRALEQGREVPILFLTADDRKETQVAAIEAGGDDLIHKPSFNSQLVIRARSLLRVQSLQHQLRVERDHLRETQRQREMLQHFVVHDLKSSLQSIQCMAEMLEHAPRESAMEGQLVPRILESVQSMDRMAQDLLDIARCESGMLAADRSRFMLEPMARKWIEEVKPQFEWRGQQVRAVIPPTLVMEADPELLRRCFLNLLANSAKYSPRGGETQVDAEIHGRNIRINVRDQGPGVPQDMRERIFDPFVRLARDAEHVRTSSGLGLAFCHAVAQIHGGRIWVESNEPVGAMFCLELPRQMEETGP